VSRTRASYTAAEVVASVGDARLARGAETTPITGVQVDSRRVKPGDVFVAISGQSQDGHRYIDAAIAAGATAIALEESGLTEAASVPAHAAIIVCASARRFAAAVAAEFAGHPSRAMSVVAITGTSGKTTTAWILEQIFSSAGYATGLIGTIEYRFAGQREEAPLTTPDALLLQDLLARMREAGVTHVVLEASSHALALDRLPDCSFDAGIYTNLTRDHLDFHIDLESYAAQKARLFRELLPRSQKRSVAVLNAVDAESRRLAGDLEVEHVFFGEGGDVRAENVTSDLDGLRGTLVLGDQSVAFACGLIGAPHLSNVLAASAAAWRLGLDAEQIAGGLSRCQGVPGRLEPIREGQPFAVIVDYAHKPDALERTLESLRSLTQSRLIVVFGCGGDRDRGKRAMMGEIAGRLADRVILTSDNPRSEDPLAILEEIEEGVRACGLARSAPGDLEDAGRAAYTVVPERRDAISLSLRAARPGDLVLIAGKGHEDYQIVAGEKVHFDDREEVRRALGAAA
jgi:UDP-N-acetylmuramoyl-L-alanyl-D-glutamate--2,6-diaminopimelate ligase